MNPPTLQDHQPATVGDLCVVERIDGRYVLGLVTSVNRDGIAMFVNVGTGRLDVDGRRKWIVPRLLLKDEARLALGEEFPELHAAKVFIAIAIGVVFKGDERD